ncbi:MAG: two-component system sensor histidine kinase/response regulator [Rubritepida sp.]|nr:two-component system sensor histidine kinase/response regulator [Rubritepida sp.]
MKISTVPAHFDVDLTNCDREPVHLIGAIQPVGFLVALSADWLITQLSANAAKFLGRPVEALLGAPFRDVIRREAAYLIRNRPSSLHGDSVHRIFSIQLQDGGPQFDLAIHMSAGTVVLEAEHSGPPGAIGVGAMVRYMLDRMKGQADFAGEATRLLQALTGFDRVMIYRFHPDGSGEVIAEQVRTGVEPFLGLHFPASDIPAQARVLMVRNPLRMLYDVDAEPSSVVSQFDASNEQLDLSLSALRAHSTMCIEYLKNMGVGATMTISILRDGELWGMVSCHHMSPRHIGFEQRRTAELFVEMLSFLMEKQERDEIGAYEAATRDIHNELIAAVVEKGTAGDNLASLADRMAELIPCDGIAVCVHGTVTLKGSTPTREEFAALRRHLDGIASPRIYSTEELGRDYPAAREFEAGCAAGMLAIPVSRSPRDYLVFFRHELARDVHWAGVPGKLEVSGPNGIRLTPRKSFEAWREIVRGHCKPWAPAELRAAEALRVTLLEVVLHLTGMTEKETQAAARTQEILIAELNHRVRNILGLIQGLVAQSRISADDVDTFAAVLGDRVRALARAHDQITATNWGPGSLNALIATEVAAYRGAGAARIHVSGPAVLLQPQAFSTVALVIHELATNAAKYGALSVRQGRVIVEWTLDAEGGVVLDWIEVGGPVVQAPTRRGFGMTIIERSIPHEIGGEARIDYEPAGLRGSFRVPGHYVVIDEAPALAGALAPASPPPPVRLFGTVLLVEDNMIVALDAENMLLGLGAARVRVARGVAQAMEFIDAEVPSFALLDVNLGPETSWPVAIRLRELGVPHVFATGYGGGDHPPEHRGTPSITKPYSAASIAKVLGMTQPAIERQPPKVQTLN